VPGKAAKVGSDLCWGVICHARHDEMVLSHLVNAFANEDDARQALWRRVALAFLRVRLQEKQ